MIRRLVCALALSLLPGFAGAAPSSVVLIGDSITQGVMSEPVGPSYAELLASSLGGEFEIANVACGGSSSLDWTRSRGDVICGGTGFVLPDLYEARALPELPADIVSVLLGTNDAIGYFEPEPVAADVYHDAIAEIVANLLLDGASRVLLMTPPPHHWSLSTQLRLFSYRSQILSLCGAPGDAVLCGPDVFNLLEPSDFASGTIHPNAFGQAKIANALHDSILAAVPEPGSAPLALVGLAALAASRRRGAGRTRASRPTRVGRRAAGRSRAKLRAG